MPFTCKETPSIDELLMIFMRITSSHINEIIRAIIIIWKFLYFSPVTIRIADKRENQRHLVQSLGDYFVRGAIPLLMDKIDAFSPFEQTSFNIDSKAYAKTKSF